MNNNILKIRNDLFFLSQKKKNVPENRHEKRRELLEYSLKGSFPCKWVKNRYFFSSLIPIILSISSLILARAEFIISKFTTIKASFSCKRGFSLLNFERGLKKNYGLPNLETLCSYYSLLETVLILCKNIESFLRYDCSKWDSGTNNVICFLFVFESSMEWRFCFFKKVIFTKITTKFAKFWFFFVKFV